MSFKVICVNADFFPTSLLAKQMSKGVALPEITKEYTVIDEDNDGGLYYELSEIPPSGSYQWIWDARAFIRVAGPCEKAIAEKRITEDAAHLDKEWYRLMEEMVDPI